LTQAIVHSSSLTFIAPFCIMASSDLHIASLIWPVHVCCAANTAGEHSATIAL